MNARNIFESSNRGVHLHAEYNGSLETGTGRESRPPKSQHDAMNEYGIATHGWLSLADELWSVWSDLTYLLFFGTERDQFSKDLLVATALPHFE